jgi:hypothetical protein
LVGHADFIQVSLKMTNESKVGDLWGPLLVKLSEMLGPTASSRFFIMFDTDYYGELKRRFSNDQDLKDLPKTDIIAYDIFYLIAQIVFFFSSILCFTFALLI